MRKERMATLFMGVLGGVLLANAGWQWGANREWSCLLIAWGCMAIALAVWLDE